MADLPKNLFVGTAGWSYPDWEGIFYPRKKPRGFDELRYLARYFNAVELNNTFYRPPLANYAKRWVERTADAGRFHFTLKLWQRFTHERQQPYTNEDLRTFKEGIEPLAASDRLGGILIQFPWSFQSNAENAEYLERLSADFAEYRRFIEVRHKSWQNEEAFDFFRRLGLNWTNIDQPISKTSVRPSALVTGDAAYVRLHGRNYKAWFDRDAGRDERYNYLYSDDELDEWVQKIQTLVGTVDFVYAFTNNHFRGQAPANSLQIVSKLTGAAVDVPETLAETYPFLRDIARTDAADRTGRLF
ncbi:MAG: hypothetical protein AMS16_05550 [Planctomycetes bacterium DG_58]|nr:MAG: hypothetical protein AMS16_05550 [Planctomycetes bacterium DG_58]KPL01640.1 MAG: hypothetical protein AMK75_04190 [Planctomycetes bacterium SM23_65]